MFITLTTCLLFDSSIVLVNCFWFRQWQSSTSLEFMVTPVSLKIFKTVCSKLLFGILSPIRDISKHSSLEYCSFAAHFLSRIWFYFTKLSLNQIVCDSIFASLSLKEVSSAFMFDNILWNLFWHSITIFDHSSLVSSFNALSDIAIANLKLNFKKSQLQIKNLKTNQKTYACYTYKLQARTK